MRSFLRSIFSVILIAFTFFSCTHGLQKKRTKSSEERYQLIKPIVIYQKIKRSVYYLVIENNIYGYHIKFCREKISVPDYGGHIARCDGTDNKYKYQKSLLLEFDKAVKYYFGILHVSFSELRNSSLYKSLKPSTFAAFIILLGDINEKIQSQKKLEIEKIFINIKKYSPLNIKDVYNILDQLTRFPLDL